MSTDNPVIMLIFLIYSLILCWGNVSNNTVTMKFAQIQYFLSQNVGGDKRCYVPPLSKSCGGHVPPINSVPARLYHCAGPLWSRHFASVLRVLTTPVRRTLRRFQFLQRWYLISIGVGTSATSMLRLLGFGK